MRSQERPEERETKASAHSKRLCGAGESAASLKRLLKYWSGSCVEAEGRMSRSEGGASLPHSWITTERLAPARVTLILALAGVARWAEIAADIDAALRALANAKIHSNATHSSISTVS